MLVEIKRVNIDLIPKHLKQAASYAINIGCEWVLLTNGREWNLYHIAYGQPPQTKLVDSWHLINDTPVALVDKFDMIGYRNVKRGELARLWERSSVTTPHNILKIILSEDSITSIRRELKRATGILISPEEIVGAIRHLLNESAGAEMESIKISLPVRKPRKSSGKMSKIAKEEKSEANLS